MAKYSNVVYKGSTYGQLPRLLYNVEPFYATSINYYEIALQWASPTGDFTAIRLVRNQDGLPETEEDGVILYEEIGSQGTLSRTSFTDGKDNFEDTLTYGNTRNDIPLVPGKYVYYRMWLRKNDNTWAQAGDVYTILPKSHTTKAPGGTKRASKVNSKILDVTQKSVDLMTTQDKFMSIIPKVFTTATQSPLDEVDKTSTLYNFIEGFSLTIDEFLTLADLILPEASLRTKAPALVALNASQLGLPKESAISVKNQKRLVREALYMYSRKGTLNALNTYVESLTGFNPVITTSPNIMLSAQDSTFYKGKGFWQVIGGCELTVDQTIIPSTAESLQIDNSYTGKVVVATSGARIKNGEDAPVTRGIPVDAGTQYTFSYYVQKTTATGAVVPSITWYDYKGAKIGSTVVGTSSDATTSWTKKTLTARAPGYSGVVSNSVLSSYVATLTVPSGHPFTIGSSIAVSGVGSPYDGTYTVTAVTSTSVSYAKAGQQNVSSAIVNGLISIEETAAVYASLDIQFNAVGTYYLDMLQLANSSTTTYNEARGVYVFLTPKKYNYLLNPSFELNNGDWAIDATTTTYPASTVPGVYANTKMLQVVAKNNALTSISAQSPDGLLVTGKFYTFSIYARTQTETETINMRVQAFDRSNVALQVERVIPITLTNTWVRYEVNLYVPTTFTAASTYSIVSLFGTTTGKTIQFDAAQLEPFFQSTDYFDGSMPANYGAVWAGSANHSISYQYTNKLITIPRLSLTIQDYLPANTPYRVTSYAGTEFTGIS